MFPSRRILLLACAVLAGGCGDGVDSSPSERPPLRVSVAASLAPAVRTAAEQWTAETGIPVVLDADATSRLVEQLRRGAPADLLLSADRRWMEEAGRAELVVLPAVRLAANSLVLVESRAGASRSFPAEDTPPDAPPEAGSAEARPLEARTLDTGAPGARDPDAQSADPPPIDADRVVARLRALRGPLALAGEEVPAGRYAREVLASLGLRDAEFPLATGGSVRTALEWVSSGDAELGIVYASDARAQPGVRVLHRFDPARHTPVEALGAAVAGGRTTPARDLLAHLAGPRGQRVLVAAGFEAIGPVAAEESAPASAAPSGPSLTSALILSLVVALLAVLLGTVPAVAFGRFLATRSFPGRSLISGLLLAPLVIPPVVTGFLLLTVLGAGSPLGRALAEAGLRVPFTPLAAVIAACVVGLPLYAVVVRNAFHAVDPRYEELSWTLGVPPRTTFRRVALPLALPGIAAGAVLAFARALGEFGATIVLAGNVEGETRTLALAVFSLLETPGASGEIWAFVGASVVLSLMGLVLYERLLEGQRRRMDDGRSH